MQSIAHHLRSRRGKVFLTVLVFPIRAYFLLEQEVNSVHIRRVVASIPSKAFTYALRLGGAALEQCLVEGKAAGKV
jgi:hypothetical protein